MWLSSVYGGRQVQPAPVCHPCRGFLVILDPFPHRFHGGLNCDVPPGLPATQDSPLPTSPSPYLADLILPI
jgi:hypothetical protein